MVDAGGDVCRNWDRFLIAGSPLLESTRLLRPKFLSSLQT